MKKQSPGPEKTSIKFDPSKLTVEEIKQKKLNVQYVYPDNFPSDVSLRRMQYFTSFPELPDCYYHGFSFRTSWQKDDLERWVAKGQIWKLKSPIILEYQNDLFFDSHGNIISACGHNPVNDPNKQIVAMRQSYKQE
ncbi:MAG: hypothetical protein MUD00_00255 [Candidatus Pacebacteria bacterium]|jgi:hypothetical protein|nr:hypothetical protein [Candidatus Paceibacterota bacterium]